MKKSAAALSLMTTVFLSAGEIRTVGSNPFPDIPAELNPEWFCFENPDMKLFRKKMLTKVPEKIGSLSPKKVRFKNDLYQFKRKKCVLTDHSLFFNEFETERDAMLLLGFGADWFMKVWLDSQVLVDTLKNGNKEADISTGNFMVRVPARKGKHLLVAEVHSGQRSYVFAAGKPPLASSQASRLFSAIAETDWHRIDAKRQACMDVFEKAVLNDVSSTVFDTFNRLPGARLDKYYEPFPILAIYDGALDKVLAEIPETAVPEGTVVLWHLYNMGYVIKTHKHCFGIDLHHRRAHLLEPYLEFLLTTHNHSDHQNPELFKAMVAHGKKIHTSFYPAPGYMRDPGTIRIDDIEITTGKADHNKNLPYFITTYQIRIGKGKNACVIYHTGDACNHEQLNPDQHVNLWICHPRVGLDTVKAAAKFKPDRILFSHFLEMGHCHPSPWRPVNFREVQEKDIPGCAKSGVAGSIPLWGEKLVWNTHTK